MACGCFEKLASSLFVMLSNLLEPSKAQATHVGSFESSFLAGDPSLTFSILTGVSLIQERIMS
jgi:hypothetical protein